jgi:hypothetical protein
MIEHDDRVCMNCHKPESMRILTSIGNERRLWLCYDCHQKLVKLFDGWLNGWLAFWSGADEPPKG